VIEQAPDAAVADGRLAHALVDAHVVDPRQAEKPRLEGCSV
jgi:hypothetical protein